MVATNANGQSTSVMTALYQALMPATAEYWRKLDHSLNSRQELCAWLNEALNWWEQHKHILPALHRWIVDFCSESGCAGMSLICLPDSPCAVCFSNNPGGLLKTLRPRSPLECQQIAMHPVRTTLSSVPLERCYSSQS